MGHRGLGFWWERRQREREVSARNSKKNKKLNFNLTRAEISWSTRWFVTQHRVCVSSALECFLRAIIIEISWNITKSFSPYLGRGALSGNLVLGALGRFRVPLESVYIQVRGWGEGWWERQEAPVRSGKDVAKEKLDTAPYHRRLASCSRHLSAHFFFFAHYLPPRSWAAFVVRWESGSSKWGGGVKGGENDKKRRWEVGRTWLKKSLTQHLFPGPSPRSHNYGRRHNYGPYSFSRFLFFSRFDTLARFELSQVPVRAGLNSFLR